MNDTPINHGKEWSTEHMWKLITLYDSPRTWESIAREMGRSIGACQARVTVIKIAFALSSTAGLMTIAKSAKINEKRRRPVNDERDQIN